MVLLAVAMISSGEDGEDMMLAIERKEEIDVVASSIALFPAINERRRRFGALIHWDEVIRMSWMCEVCDR